MGAPPIGLEVWPCLAFVVILRTMERSCPARRGTTTGISASDRACTIATLIDPRTRPCDLLRPGHVFPLRYAESGVLTRRGHTEASVDLARLAGLYPAAVICEVMNDDGTMARRKESEGFGRRYGLPLVSIEQIAAHRTRWNVT